MYDDIDARADDDDDGSVVAAAAAGSVVVAVPADSVPEIQEEHGVS